MRIDSAVLAGANVRPVPSGAQKVEQARQSSSRPPEDNKQVQPEEILSKIKDLTEDGTYSIRFELNKNTDKLIINLVDKETGDIIRQIPPEELINASEKMQDIRGMIISAEG
jgi:flagellar protein FlaG